VPVETISLIGELALRGFACRSAYLPGASSSEAFASIGTVLTLDGFDPIQSLIPRVLSRASPNTYSGNFGMGQFPFHTDLAHWAVPPRFVALRCVRGVGSVLTHLLDGRFVVERVGRSVLHRALVQPRRSLRNGRHLLRLLDVGTDVGEQRLRWDSLYLRPATAASGDTMKEVHRCLVQLPATNVSLSSRGDTLVIDNWRVLHGRSPVPEHARHRRIDRAYLGGVL
jgi:L-asparagine oxygenase